MLRRTLPFIQKKVTKKTWKKSTEATEKHFPSTNEIRTDPALIQQAAKKKAHSAFTAAAGVASSSSTSSASSAHNKNNNASSASSNAAGAKAATRKSLDYFSQLISRNAGGTSQSLFSNHEDVLKNGTFLEKRLFQMHEWMRLIRFDKPVGTRLLFIPCCWGTTLAATKAIIFYGADFAAVMAPTGPITYLVAFYVGAFNLRAAGCVINDMWDRDFDKLVERTKDRPLAKGTITMSEAAQITAVHLGLGLVTLVVLPTAAIQAAFAAVPLVVLYPLMKRITYFPQVFLGLTFNWGIFVGYAAVMNRVDFAVCVPMYMAGIVWTVLYDTIYAHQDAKDDVKAGVKSTALAFGEDKKPLYLMTMPIFTLTMVAGMGAGQPVFFCVPAAASIYFLIRVIDAVNVHDRWSCERGFKRNVRFGMLLWLSMVMGNVLWIAVHDPDEDDEEIVARAKKLEGASAPTMAVLSEYSKLQLHSASTGDVDPSFLDRFMKPAYCHALHFQKMIRKAEEEGNHEKAKELEDNFKIPPWTRREYLAENFINILRAIGYVVPATGYTRDYCDETELYLLTWLDPYTIASRVF